VHGISQQADAWRGAVTNLATNFDADFSLADGGSATYFFQFLREGSGDIDGLFGLADGPASIDTINPTDDYAVLARIVGSSRGRTELRAYSEGLGDVTVRSSVLNDIWYNVWLVVDNDTKTYDIYTSTDTDDANADEPTTFRLGLNFGRDLDVTDLLQFGLNEGRSNNSPSDGALTVVTNVDLAGNGFVDGGDFLAIQRNHPELLGAWNAQFGQRLVVSEGSRLSPIPEPSALNLLLVAGGCGLGLFRSRHNRQRPL
jgi:hypothetical protein